MTHLRELGAAELASVEGGSFWGDLWNAIVEFFVCLGRPCT
jgi:hypothetical protein